MLNSTKIAVNSIGLTKSVICTHVPYWKQILEGSN